VTHRDDDAAAVARRIVASVLAEHGVDDERRETGRAPGAAPRSDRTQGERSETDPSPSGGTRLPSRGTRGDVEGTEARRTARRIVEEALAAAGIATAEPPTAEVTATQAPTSARTPAAGGDAAEAGASAGGTVAARSVEAGPPPVPTPAQRIAHRIVQDALAAAEARRREESQRREQQERERREPSTRSEEQEVSPVASPAVAADEPVRDDAAALPGDEPPTEALPVGASAASPGDEPPTEPLPANGPVVSEPALETIVDVPVAPPQARPTVDVDGPAVARRLVADVLTARRERATAAPTMGSSPDAGVVEPDAASSEGGPPFEFPSQSAGPGHQPGPPPPPAAAFRSLRRDLGIHDEPTTALEREERPPRRTGRWLLATILGAITLALLFPLTVAAVRALISLSVIALP
jgi:hypothetical protein